MSKDAYYFSHDTNARNSPKCSALIYNWGIEGYGFYWIIVELLSTSENNKLKINDLILSEYKIKPELIKYCVEIGLFKSDGIHLWADNFKFRKTYISSNLRLYNVNIKLWHEIREMVFERDNYKCQYCGKRGGKLEVDHITPISKGGNNDPTNLATACRRCNRQKKDKTVAEFMDWKVKHG